MSAKFSCVAQLFEDKYPAAATEGMRCGEVQGKAKAVGSSQYYCIIMPVVHVVFPSRRKVYRVGTEWGGGGGGD